MSYDQPDVKKQKEPPVKNKKHKKYLTPGYARKRKKYLDKNKKIRDGNRTAEARRNK